MLQNQGQTRSASFKARESSDLPTATSKWSVGLNGFQRQLQLTACSAKGDLVNDAQDSSNSHATEPQAGYISRV